MPLNEMPMVAGVLAVGMACQWLAWRITVPAILPLLAAGFLTGPVLGLLHPQATLGELFFPLPEDAGPKRELAQLDAAAQTERTMGLLRA
jgi:NhaP-type Na+/H+ or K+/H+ antiporter